MAVAIEPSSFPEPLADPHQPIREGMLLAGRYRVGDRTSHGWLAYDERLTRSVLINAILGEGDPAERVRREASAGLGLLDAIIFGDEAFAVLTT
jgi:hypothetical protein